MVLLPGEADEVIHCRIGSSEIDGLLGFAAAVIHCRIGSSEMAARREVLRQVIHCRIGSSEISSTSQPAARPYSLPHRQLRNQASGRAAVCSLFTAA